MLICEREKDSEGEPGIFSFPRLEDSKTRYRGYRRTIFMYFLSQVLERAGYSRDRREEMPVALNLKRKALSNCTKRSLDITQTASL